MVEQTFGLFCTGPRNGSVGLEAYATESEIKSTSHRLQSAFFSIQIHPLTPSLKKRRGAKIPLF